LFEAQLCDFDIRIVDRLPVAALAIEVGAAKTGLYPCIAQPESELLDIVVIGLAGAA